MTAPKEDVLAISPVIEDTGEYTAIRKTGEEYQSVKVKFLKDGEAISSGSTYAHITRRAGSNLYDVEEVYTNAPAPSSEGGQRPALVNSQAYLEGWDSIFGKKNTVGQA